MINTTRLVLTSTLLTLLFTLTACQSGPDAGKNGKDSKADQKPSEEVQKLLTMQDHLSQIVKSGDLTKCAGLEMPQYQKSCESNILANKAKDALDKTVCDPASSEEIKTQCLRLVEAKQ